MRGGERVPFKVDCFTHLNRFRLIRGKHMNKHLANARFSFLYVFISAIAVGIAMTYSLIAGLAWWQTALVLIGGVVGACATLFTVLEVRRIAQTPEQRAAEALIEQENPDALPPVVVLPPTGDPCPHHEDYPESAGFSEEQLVFRTPDRTPLIEDFLDRRAKRKQQAAR